MATLNSFAVIDEYLDNKEDCFNNPDNRDIMDRLEKVFSEVNKADNDPALSKEEKMQIANANCSLIYKMISENPFLVCSYLLEETKMRKNTSLVSKAFVGAIKAHCNKYHHPEVMFAYAELCRTHYCYERLNDSVVSSLYQQAANKGHKLSAVRIRQAGEIMTAQKLLMTPYDKGAVRVTNVAKGISILHSLFDQGRIDVVPELLRNSVEVGAWSVVKDVLFFLDNPSYVEQFKSQINMISKDEYVKTLRKLYRKAKWHVFFDKIGDFIRILLYIALFLGAGWLFLSFRGDSVLFLLSFFYVYFTIGSFIIKRPLYTLLFIPFMLLSSLVGSVSMDWDEFGEALVLSSII